MLVYSKFCVHSDISIIDQVVTSNHIILFEG